MGVLAVFLLRKNGYEKELTGRFRLEEETTTGCEPEYDLAAGFSPVKIAFGEEDPDRRPDTVLAVVGLQRMNNMTYVAALLVSNCLENIDVRWGRHKDLGSFVGDFFHNLVLVTGKTQMVFLILLNESPWYYMAYEMK